MDNELNQLLADAFKKATIIAGIGAAVAMALLLATPAFSMTKAQVENLCNRKAVAMAYTAAPNYYYVRNQAELAGAEIGTALGMLLVASITKAECMRSHGFAPKRPKSKQPVGSTSRLKG